MKRIIPILMLMIVAAVADGQIISKFSWNSNPVTKAVIGPDAISVSATATSSINGVSGTNGLNAGTPSTDINLTLTGSTFDVPGIDISVYFRKEENEASFFKRGSNFNFGMTGGQLYVTFMVNKNANGTGGANTINSGNIVALANDHAFHNYRFQYMSSTGVAKVWVDGTLVYTYTGTANRNMYWTGAGNAVIGSQMDGTGSNVSILDEMIIQNSAAAAALPLQLLAFTAQSKTTYVELNWSTSKEVNTQQFDIERSANGRDFNKLASVNAAGGYTTINQYAYKDINVLNGVAYYRLKMIDADGKFTYSEVKQVNMGSQKSQATVYPNPTSNYVVIENNFTSGNYNYSVVNTEGKTIQSKTIQLAAGTKQVKIDLTSINEKGVLFIQWRNNTNGTKEVFSVVKK